MLTSPGPHSLPAVAAGAPVDVSTPQYERTSLRRSIVHIGVGGFHRAHLATYVHELCEAGVRDWAIVGVGVLDSDRPMADVLESQHGLYTLISRGADDVEVSVMGSIVDFVMSAGDPAPLAALVSSADTEILSLTITEGGYPVDDRTGAFSEDRCPPGSTFDLIAHALDARRRSDAGSLTVLSCDNILGNGMVTRTATLGAAARVGGATLVDWISANVSFPNSMVDRITPVTDANDIAWLASEYDVADQWPVVAEPFRQWVVEDDFAGRRLPLEDMDVIVTDAIEPYELTKLRLLNAGHSCLTYLAALDGHVAVDAAMADERLGHFVETLLHLEAKPTLPPAAGIDLDDYIASLVERFSNPGVGDQIARLCIDGSSKFPKFLLPTIEAQLEAGGPIELAALALAGWCEYLVEVGTDAAYDPLLDTALRHAAASVEQPVAFLDFDEVFGTRIAHDHRFRTAFAAALQALREQGVQSALSDAL
ncbi:MAG: mannitol dehydrogenase family protein [Ilumatobacter sp.]